MELVGEDQALAVERISTILDRFGLSEYFFIEDLYGVVSVFTKNRRALYRNVLFQLRSMTLTKGQTTPLWYLDTVTSSWLFSWMFDWPSELISEKNTHLIATRQTGRLHLTVAEEQIVNILEGPLGFWSPGWTPKEKPATLFMLAFLPYSHTGLDLHQYEQYFGMGLAPESILYFHERNMSAMEAEKYRNLPFDWVKKLLEDKEGGYSE